MVARVALLVLGAAASAHAGALELTPDNFDAEVTKSGKNAFVKFLAPCVSISYNFPSLPALVYTGVSAMYCSAGEVTASP